LTLSYKIQTCFLWHFGMHKLWHKFVLSSQRTSHPISILQKILRTELHSRFHLLISFLIMFHLIHIFWSFIFLSCITSSRFLFILAFRFLLQPCKDACLPLLDISQMLWQMVFLSVFVLPLCWGVLSHTRHSIIYWVQTTVITDEALLHTECNCSVISTKVIIHNKM
jgi:hypothetical protein